jgi:hypothetical protein
MLTWSQEHGVNFTRNFTETYTANMFYFLACLFVILPLGGHVESITRGELHQKLHGDLHSKHVTWSQEHGVNFTRNFTETYTANMFHLLAC